MKSTLLAVLALLTLSPQSQAPRPHPTSYPYSVPTGTMDSWSFETGNRLYDECSGKEELPAVLCMSYVRGAVDLFGQLQGDVTQTSTGTLAPMWALHYICVPKRATDEQAKDVVLKYLQSHPEERADRASSLIIRALIAAWGCPKSK